MMIALDRLSCYNDITAGLQNTVDRSKELWYISVHGPVAQMAEQLTLNQLVRGSSPLGVTNLR